MEDLLWCARLSQEGGPLWGWCPGVLAVPRKYPGYTLRFLISRAGSIATNVVYNEYHY